MACFSGPEIVNSGIVLHLDAANSRSYPGTGNTWFDISGRGNHFNLVNTPTFNTNAISFDGVNEYAVSANSINLTDTNAVTFFYFIKINNYGTSVKIIHEFSNNFNDYTDSFVASYSDNSVEQNFEVFASLKGNTGYNIGVYNKSLLNDGAFHCHCVIHDMSAVTKENLIYSDGAIKNEIENPRVGYAANNTGNFGNRQLFLMSRAGTGFFAQADISTLIMYNRALSATEIQQNFNALRGRYGI